jgi:branched-chain amino acid transport system permease protein
VLLGVASEYLKLKIPYGHLVVYGIIIVLVILLLPQGLYGQYRKRVGAGARGRGLGRGRGKGLSRGAACG